MIEYPVFVPLGEDHLAAVITVPDQEPEGMVLLLAGTGAPRSHRFQLWAKVARRLAEYGLASVRMDYRGMGDSTGLLRQLAMRQPRVDQALAVARFAMRATGASRLCVVGHCSGSLVALAVASQVPECAAAVCVLPRILDPSPVNRLAISARRSRLAAFVRNHPLMNRIADRFRGRSGKPGSNARDQVSRALEHGRLLFLYSERDIDAYSDRVQAELSKIMAPLPRELRERFDLIVLPGGPVAGLETLSIQRAYIEQVVGWVASSMGRSPAAVGEHRQPEQRQVSG